MLIHRLLLLLLSLAAAQEPRLYIYQLNSELNTFWVDLAFESEDQRTRQYARDRDMFSYTDSALYGSLVNNPYRVENPDHANIFFVPVFVGVLSNHNHHEVASKNLLTALNHVRNTTHWRRNNGVDHFFPVTDGTNYCWNALNDRNFDEARFIVVPTGQDGCIHRERLIFVPPFSDSLLRATQKLRSDPQSFITTSKDYLLYFRGALNESCPWGTHEAEQRCRGNAVRRSLLASRPVHIWHPSLTPRTSEAESHSGEFW